jgi:hypothetical protein
VAHGPLRTPQRGCPPEACRRPRGARDPRRAPPRAPVPRRRPLTRSPTPPDFAYSPSGRGGPDRHGRVHADSGLARPGGRAAGVRGPTSSPTAPNASVLAGRFDPRLTRALPALTRATRSGCSALISQTLHACRWRPAGTFLRATDQGSGLGEALLGHLRGASDAEGRAGRGPSCRARHRLIRPPLHGVLERNPRQRAGDRRGAPARASPLLDRAGATGYDAGSSPGSARRMRTGYGGVHCASRSGDADHVERSARALGPWSRQSIRGPIPGATRGAAAAASGRRRERSGCRAGAA